MKSLLISAGIVIVAVLLAFAVGIPLLRPPKAIIYAKPRPAAATAPGPLRQTNTLYLAAPTRLAGGETNLPVPTLIARELARQALLVAAREELGLFTRDGVLREPPPDHDVRDSSLRFDVGFRQGPVIPISVYEDVPRGRKIFSQDLRLPGDYNHPDMLKLIEEAEAQSRGRYVELLKMAGFRPPGSTELGEGQPELSKALRRLDELTEVSQFAAVRSAHAAMRSHPSPEALGILVRGYANLAQLARPEWSPATDVFAARSLLYAQRMVATEPKNTAAHWHRAYALSLFGLHRDAIDEIRVAQKIASESKPASPRPPWADLLDPLCHYNTDWLLKAGSTKNARAPLPMFLAFLTAENCGSDSVSIEVAKKALEANPKCVRIIDAICDKSGVAYLHVATELGPSVHQAALSDELGELEPLPANVSAAVQSLRQGGAQPASVAAVGDSLVKAREEVEPSWAAVGRTLQEIDFLHVRRRAEFMSHWWGVDTSEFVRQATPLVADHPYLPLIKAYGLYTDSRPDPFLLYQTLRAMEFVDPRVIISRTVQFTQNGAGDDRLVGDLAWRRALEDMDLTAYDIEPTLPITQPDQLRRASGNALRRAWHVRVASPFSAVAKATYILLDWNQAKNSLELWSKEHPDHPAITGTLARKYSELKQYDQSEKYWTAYLRVAHDAPAYRHLADDYLKDGKEDQWLRTLADSLGQEDFGLEHAITNEKIARHFMEAKAFDKARPFADAAAQSGSEASMFCAAECYEGLRQWATSERYMRDDAERYQRPINWLYWCKRTGHGDVAGAMAASRRYVQGIKSRTDGTALTNKVDVFLLDGHPDTAVEPLQMMLDTSGSPWAAVHLGLIHLEQGKKDAARDVFQKGAQGGGMSPALRGMAVTAQYMAAALRPDQPTRFSVSDIHFAVDSLPVDLQINVWYVTGKFLKIQGRKDEAIDCFKRAAFTNHANRLDAILAIHELRDAGEIPSAF